MAGVKKRVDQMENKLDDMRQEIDNKLDDFSKKLNTELDKKDFNPNDKQKLNDYFKAFVGTMSST